MTSVLFLLLQAAQLFSSYHLLLSPKPLKTFVSAIKVPLTFKITLVHLALEILELVIRNISPAAPEP